MCWTAERGFDSDSRTPGAARGFVGSNLRGVLGALRTPEVIDDIELVVSELVTNAIRAGADAVHIALQVHHGELELDVTDDGPGWPRLAQPGELEPRGRGLVLVDALADAWRTDRVDECGKRVRVTIAIPGDLTGSLSCDRPVAAIAPRRG